MKKNKGKNVYINGYYKDDELDFYNYKCKLGLDVADDESDDDIFYYFEDEKDIKEHMIDIFKGVDFIVTKYIIGGKNAE